MKTLEIKIDGLIPPKKNSKRVIRNKYTGRTMVLPSESHEAWHKTQMQELEKIQNIPMGGISHIEVNFQVPDKRKRDLSNMFESIADLLQDADIIESDNCFVLNDIRLKLDLNTGIKKDCTTTITIYYYEKFA